MKAIKSIQNRIYEIRGERVMLDSDLSVLYDTETKFLNLAVKRNIKRFPKDFMFQLTNKEFEELRLQIATSKVRGGRKYLPYVFTEQGVAMLSGILNSDRAINMNIAIMRAFVQVRRTLIQESDIRQQLKLIKKRLGNHDQRLTQIYTAMEDLVDEISSEKKWKERERIGFKNY